MRGKLLIKNTGPCGSQHICVWWSCLSTDSWHSYGNSCILFL